MTFPYLDRRDIDFLLFDWLSPDWGAAGPDTVRAVLDLSERLALDAFAPHNRKADQTEPALVEGQVTLIPEIEAALAAYRDAGLSAADFPESLGGSDLPMTAAMASFAFFSAANIATCGYILLAKANARLLAAHASPAQVAQWAVPQIEGRAYGTMCLSEPQAGSSLGDIRTRARPDGSDALGARYRLSGTKMWISGGEHGMGENIVHLVLAKVPGQDGALPPGTAGISLFAVPRILPDGTRNDVAVAGLNHKMGYRGTVNCLLNFGERDGGATGWRIGAEGAGLRIMFQMMNEARIAVGLGAAALACRGYRQSLAYARERPQGRLPGAKDPAAPPVAILAHPDVRRMLIRQKVVAEAAMGMVLFCAHLVDLVRAAPEAATRAEAEALLGLLTPVAKSWPSEEGLNANSLAIQIHGGYGYTRDFDVEQVWRDNRLNPIHEGTTGIQALDLLGRKVLRDDGAALDLLARRIAATCTAARAAGMADLADPVAAAMADLRAAVAGAGPDADALANATPFLAAFGHLVAGWLWLDMATVAARKAAAGTGDPDHLAGKRIAAAYFIRRELPRIGPDLAALREGCTLPCDLPDAGF
jgi:alkylation response protein AidB-like acyl-CoA dehydrogenase